MVGGDGGGTTGPRGRVGRELDGVGSTAVAVGSASPEDIVDVVARLRAHGAELIGEVAQHENAYLLCYVRGPGGIVVALAEQLS